MSEVYFRPYRAARDVEGMARVHEGSAADDRIDAESTLEGVPSVQELKDRLNDNHRDPFADIIIAEADGRLVGYAQTGWWLETDGTRLHIIHGHLLPAFRNKGIGSAQVAWAEKRSLEISKTLPAAQRAFFGGNASSLQPARIKLLGDHGYKQAFSLVEMTNNNLHAVGDAGMPEGFELRTAEPGHVRAIWEANNRAYQGRDFISAPTEEEYADFIGSAGSDFGLWQVAWQGDRIAGFVLSKIAKGRGEITQVSVVPEFRKRGLGEALMKKNIRSLKEKGITKARLHTSGENVAGAQNLYQKLGFETVKKFNRYRKPVIGG